MSLYMYTAREFNAGMATRCVGTMERMGVFANDAVGMATHRMNCMWINHEKKDDNSGSLYLTDEYIKSHVHLPWIEIP